MIATSADSPEEAATMQKDHQVPFPIAHSLDVVAFSEKTGAFLSKDRDYLHATAFIIRPDGKVALAVYSTGPVGRLTAKEAGGYIKWEKSNK